MTSTVSSMPGASANAPTQCSTSVFPARVSSCLGSAAPNRVPKPPPSTTATIRVTVTWGLYPRVSRRGYPRQLVGAQVRWGSLMPGGQGEDPDDRRGASCEPALRRPSGAAGDRLPDSTGGDGQDLRGVRGDRGGLALPRLGPGGRRRAGGRGGRLRRGLRRPGAGREIARARRRLGADRVRPAGRVVHLRRDRRRG